MQYLAEASQKFTWPGVTAVVPALTVAVSTTTLPEVTVVTALSPEVTARAVVVVALACAEPTLQAPQRVSAKMPRAAATPRIFNVQVRKRGKKEEGIKAFTERRTEDIADLLLEEAAKAGLR